MINLRILVPIVFFFFFFCLIHVNSTFDMWGKKIYLFILVIDYVSIFHLLINDMD